MTADLPTILFDAREADPWRFLALRDHAVATRPHGLPRGVYTLDGCPGCAVLRFTAASLAEAAQNNHTLAVRLAKLARLGRLTVVVESPFAGLRDGWARIVVDGLRDRGRWYFCDGREQAERRALATLESHWRRSLPAPVVVAPSAEV